ncbi:MAG: hypothetical protein AB1792_04070 [Candidatus Zixiibacteriota bacterium]
MNRIVALAGMALILGTGSPATVAQGGCTAAIVSPQASVAGRPMLWKNRDTDTQSNKVVFVRDLPFSYLGLTNADDASGRKCFAGLNAAGFGIINTDAYNLPSTSGETADLEGVIMADALRTCRTVEDFEAYLEANLGPEFGSQGDNFAVMDASGRAFLFEVHNHGFAKSDAATPAERYLVVTNFSRSGTEGDGAGYLRFRRASALFQKAAPRPIAHQDILHRFTRDLGHVLLDHPELDELKNTPAGEDHWLYAGDCISRQLTAAAVVMVGRKPDDPQSLATLWVIPGQPLCAIALPLWVEAGRSPEALWNGADAPLWTESLRIKRLIWPYRERDRVSYVNVGPLDNTEGTGFLPLLLRTEQEIFVETRTFLKTRHSAEELAEFQDRMANKALEVMRSITSE